MAHVLVVDDDEAFLAVIKEMLERGGHSVVEATNSTDGVSLYRQGAFGLVIVDFFLPSEGGVEVMRAIRAKDPDARLVLISGADIRDGVDLSRIAARYGAKAALHKPLDRKTLLATVRELTAAG